jgi:hypothetical protein
MEQPGGLGYSPWSKPLLGRTSACPSGQDNAPATMTRGGVAVCYWSAGLTPARSWSLHIGTSFIFCNCFARVFNAAAVSLFATAV